MKKTVVGTISIPGIHHITAIASDPHRNLDFYTGILGLRLVKKTVNFDDPGTYHFYFGDEQGHPGTILTFFAWPRAHHGRSGTSQVHAASFAIPQGAVSFWLDRLKMNGIIVSGPQLRFGEEILSFQDPDGLHLEFVASKKENSGEVWEQGPIPAEFAIRSLHGATMSLERYEHTHDFLTETLGFQFIGENGNRFRYQAGEGESSGQVDILYLPGTARGKIAAGSVHHIAWRTENDTSQTAWSERLTQRGSHVSPVMDRQYFRSIYFREPGGILFEIATDPPGFAVDEPLDSLGGRLCLPEWLEPTRTQIEQVLPPLSSEVGASKQ